MLKKAGLLTVGVTAGLLAVAPIASAGEAESVKGEHSDKDSSKHHDGDHGKKHHGKKHHDGDQDGVGNIKCGAESGDNETSNEAEGLAAVAQAGSTLSNNAGQLASCNAFLNDVISGNEVNVLS